MKRAILAMSAVAALIASTQTAAAAGTGKPGDLVSATEITAFLAPGVPLPAKAWRITYRSTSATGQATTVSGAVLVPAQPHHGPQPLVGFAVGTHGLSDQCAPSLALARGTEYEVVTIAGMLQHGWAVAVTDYPGLSTPGEHPYLVGRALGPAVLDSMRAARNLPPAGLDHAGPLAVHGYSEGPVTDRRSRRSDAKSGRRQSRPGR